jgi:aspartate/methionine/tyrosine aminotransferase
MDKQDSFDNFPISRKAHAVKPFIVMDIMEHAQEMERCGEHIIHLEVGEPDFDTPEPVVEAAIRALRDGRTHYTHSMGLLELRYAIAAHYLDKYKVDVSPDQIIISNGTSPALSMIFNTLLSPGDEVIMTDPHYACYPNFVEFADGAPRFVPASEHQGFQYDAHAVEQAVNSRTRAILVNSPSNPGGTVIPSDTLEKIVNLGVPLVSDEIYHGLDYNGRARSALEFTDNAFVINGFSKLYAMTGWRVGYLIAPKRYIRTIQKLHQNFSISANAFVQWAAIKALTECGDHVANMAKLYNTRRIGMLNALERIGLKPPVEPTGAFYVFVNFRHVDNDSLRLAMDILEKAKVACTPGIDFGANGQGFIRFTYANSLENIEEGMRRLETYLQQRGALHGARDV